MTLKFGKGVSLLSYGKANVYGTASAPVTFTAIDKSIPWGVFALLDKNASDSTFEYALFEHGGDTYQNGVFVSGMLAAHFADVTINKCRFQFANGDDALNVKNASGIVTNSYFYKNPFDAIDFDFISEGEITNNYFKENGNDSIDLGGVDSILITNNFIESSGDKGISVGEKSKKPKIINNLIINSNIGVAIKDSSSPLIVNNTIYKNNVGLASYQKKGIFESGKGNVINTLFLDNTKTFDFDTKAETDLIRSYPGEDFTDIPEFDEANFMLLNSEKFPGDFELLKKYYDFDGNSVSIGIFKILTPVVPF